MVEDKKFLLILILSVFVQNSFSQTANDYVYCNTIKTFATGQTLLIYFAEPGNLATTCEYVVKSAIQTYISVELYHNLIGSGTSCSTQYVEISPDGDPRYRSSVKYCGIRDYYNPLKFNTIGNEIRFRVVSNDLKRTVQIKMKAWPITASNCSCSWNPSTRIANGQDTLASTFIGNVVFKTTMNGFYEAICGGTLISYYYTLTAGHCIPYMKSFGLSNVHLHVGRQNVTANVYSDTAYSEVYSIAAAVTHPNFNEITHDYDIGYVKTTSYVRFSKGVGPACAPFSYENFAIPSGTTLTAIGFGGTQFAMGAVIDKKSWILQNTRLIVNQTLLSGCNQIRKVCAQGELIGNVRGDTCQRDSGSGLYGYMNNKFYLFAITSEGLDCGSKNSYSINVPAAYYISWIKTIMGSEILCNK